MSKRVIVLNGFFLVFILLYVAIQILSQNRVLAYTITANKSLNNRDEFSETCTSAPANVTPAVEQPQNLPVNKNNDPPVDFIVINDKNCSLCETQEMIHVTETQVFPSAETRLLDRSEEAAQRLIEELGIDSYPAYIFSSSVKDTARFSDMQVALVEIGDYYIITPEASGAVLFDNAPIPDDDPIKGNPEAPVTIIEFSDFECPVCAIFHKQTFSLIDEKYIQKGIVNLVYRDNPLSFHPEAKSAAIAANCAREQGGDKIYFKMHDLIYENQFDLGEVSYKKWAGELELDVTAFGACLSSGRYDEEISNDVADAAAVGINATPSFFIGNIRLTGAQSLAVFEKAIQSQLKAKDIE